MRACRAGADADVARAAAAARSPPPIPLLGSFARVDAPATGPVTSSPFDLLDRRDGPRDECGVFGIVSPSSNVAQMAYFALYTLQHHSQESASIATAQNGHIMAMRDQGLVNQVFDEQKLHALQNDIAVGHIRYSTTGTSS